MNELADSRGKTSTLDLAVLTALNIAQELMELKNQAGSREKGDEEKLRQLIKVIDEELQAIEK